MSGSLMVVLFFLFMVVLVPTWVIAFPEGGPLKDSTMEKVSRVFGVAILIVVIIGIIVKGFSIPYGNGMGGKSGDEKNAWVCAEDCVRRQLLNPSEAKFCTYTQATIVINEDTGIYTVKGWVESTNGFGATIRQSFTCNLELTETGYKDMGVLFY